MSKPLQVLSNLPATPGRQVKYLKEELEKKENENAALKNNVNDLTKALTNLQIVSDKVGGIENVAPNTKKGKDKDAPVAAKTAYKYFCEDKGEAGKDMRLLWKECQGDDRKKYVDQAAQDKIRFDSENAVYQAKVSEKQAEDEALRMYYEKQKQDLALEFYEAHLAAQSLAAVKKKKKTKDPDAPKAPMSSYLFFCKEKREALSKKHPQSSTTEITKMLGEEWNKAKSSKKGIKKYDTLAEKDKRRYEEEKKVYDALIADRNSSVEQERQMKLENDKQEALKLMMQTRHDTLISQQEVEVEGEKEVAAPKKKVKDPNAPKAPKSSYIYFCQEKREDVVKLNPGLKPTEITKVLAAEWAKIKEVGTETYDKLSAEDKVRYENEKKAYELSKK